jgi:uncharacterized protein (DUF2267 family)
MRYGTFLTEVERLAGITRPESENAARAVLETLGERITRGEADDIAAFLPRELRRALTAAPEPAEAFGLDEFLGRVAEREGVDVQTAREHARAVLGTLGFAVAPGELRDMAAQLPADFEELLEAAGVGRRRAMDRDDLVGRVAEVTGLDRDAARRVTEAVLETLAVRISDGEVEDLEAELPADLRAALERGLRRSRAASAMSVDEFVATVADREGVSLEEAEAHTRAVFAALRAAISGKEFSDVAAQLSRDYERVLATAP